MNFQIELVLYHPAALLSALRFVWLAWRLALAGRAFHEVEAARSLGITDRGVAQVRAQVL